MDAEKLGLSFFDFLSYLLPGYVVVAGLSIIEATFFHASYLSLAAIGDNWFLFSIISYFFGIICHAFTTYAKNRFKKLFPTKKYRLSTPLERKIKSEIQEAYQIELNEGEELNTLYRYRLADSFILASGCENERSSLMVREGLFKTSLAAFFIIWLISVASLFVGGLAVQFEAGKSVSGGIIPTLIVSLIILIIDVVFWDRFVFYNRMKINNTNLLFMAYYRKERRDAKKT